MIKLFIKYVASRPEYRAIATKHRFLKFKCKISVNRAQNQIYLFLLPDCPLISVGENVSVISIRGFDCANFFIKKAMPQIAAALLVVGAIRFERMTSSLSRMRSKPAELSTHFA